MMLCSQVDSSVVTLQVTTYLVDPATDISTKFLCTAEFCWLSCGVVLLGLAMVSLAM